MIVAGINSACFKCLHVIRIKPNIVILLPWSLDTKVLKFYYTIKTNRFYFCELNRFSLLIYLYADNWSVKAIGRKTTGTGRMRHLKDVHRRFRNGFQEGMLWVAYLVFKNFKKVFCCCTAYSQTLNIHSSSVVISAGQAKTISA